MKPAATVSMILYAFGMPLVFLIILFRHRASIVRDQTLRMRGQGGTASNPDFSIRTRYQELYRYVQRLESILVYA
jgi:hypothetical protein